VSSVAEYQAIVDAEWRVIYDKLEKIVATGAKVVLSKVRAMIAAHSAPPCAAVGDPKRDPDVM
jgi:DNA-binding helix-hairpin-helix protein with protein kinase domain